MGKSVALGITIPTDTPFMRKYRYRKCKKVKNVLQTCWLIAKKWAKGLSDAEIGKEIGLSDRQVRNYRRILGLNHKLRTKLMLSEMVKSAKKRGVSPRGLWQFWGTKREFILYLYNNDILRDAEKYWVMPTENETKHKPIPYMRSKVASTGAKSEFDDLPVIDE